MRLRRLVFLPLALTFFLAGYLCAQTKVREWQYYSPPNKSFRVRLPNRLTRVKSFDAEHGVDSDPDFDKQGVRSYVSVERGRQLVRFGIVVFPKDVVGNYLTVMAKEEWKKAIALLLFGDDDESQLLSKPRTISSNDSQGVEYLFINDDRANRGGDPLYSRGRILEYEKDIYLLIFVGEGEKDLFSKDANNFFDSFEFIKSR